MRRRLRLLLQESNEFLKVIDAPLGQGSEDYSETNPTR